MVIRRTILVAASISFIGAMVTSLMAHADSLALVDGPNAGYALATR